MNWKDLHEESFTGRTALVTGGAGFIGSHIVEALVQLGAKVRVIDDLSGGDWANLDGFGDDVGKATETILDLDALIELADGCDYVFHEAALGSVPRSVEQPEAYHQVNVIGTMNVLIAAERAKVSRVVYAGSSSAYGDPPDGDTPKVETMPPLPRSPYAATKLAGEHDLRSWVHSYGLDTAVLRYFNVFGPRQNANSAYAAVIAAFAKALMTDQTPMIFGTGEQSRDFTFVHNVVHANLLAARCDQPLEGELFNVACGQRISVNHLYQQIARLLGKSHIKPEYHPTRAGDVLHSLADISRAQQTLGFEPLVSFEDGLAATVDWYRTQFK